AEDGIRDPLVTGVQTCALPISALGLVPLSRSGKTSPTRRCAREAVPPPGARSVTIRRHPAGREQASLPRARRLERPRPSLGPLEIGRASCRERGWKSGVAALCE